MERFDIFAEQNGVGAPPEEPTVNGYRDGVGDGEYVSAVAPSPLLSSSPVKRQVESDEGSEPAGTTPPTKKRKADHDVDADAVYAAKLQAEENLRARPTRGANTRRAPPSKKRSKAKTAKRVKAEVDSDIDSGSETKKKVNRSGGFHVSFMSWCLLAMIADCLVETAQPFSRPLGVVGWRNHGTLF